MHNSRVATLQCVDDLHAGHVHVVAKRNNACIQSADALLNLVMRGVEQGGELADCVVVALDSLHDKLTTIVVVELVGEESGSCVVATETSEATIAVEELAEERIHEDEPKRTHATESTAETSVTHQEQRPEIVGVQTASAVPVVRERKYFCVCHCVFVFFESKRKCYLCQRALTMAKVTKQKHQRKQNSFIQLHTLGSLY